MVTQLMQPRQDLGVVCVPSLKTQAGRGRVAANLENCSGGFYPEKEFLGLLLNAVLRKPGS